MARNILVVEDDNNISDLIRMYLEKEGFEVRIAADGGKAVEEFKAREPDLVLLDVMLPVLDGWGVCAKIRETSKCPIIMLTAKGEVNDRIHGLEMGADDYLVKPFEMKELIARINAVLRRYLREKDELEKKIASRDEVRFNAPAWWIGRIRTIYPKDADRILELGTRHPPMTLRVNVRLMTVEDYLDRLKAAGLEARRVGPEAIELVTPVPVDRIPGFADGLSSVQDAGTQLAAHLLPVKAGDRVLDACSAPGGKTAHILERADCAMTALEIDPARAVKVRETLDRLKLKADIRTADAGDTASWWDGKPFDAILLDAPCTASGVVRRQPDTPWLRRPDDIKKLASEQKRLLKTLWPLLRKGGRMLYATCSIFPEEGTGQMKAFLAATPDARLVPLFAGNDGMLTLLPEESGEWRSDAQLPTVHDGFFYALLEKQA